MRRENRIEERLRRLVAIGGAVILVIWALTARVLPQEYRLVYPAGPFHGVLTTLHTLVVPLGLLTALGAMVGTALYTTHGVSYRLFGRMVPTTARGVALLKRWTWLPADVLIALVPLLVLAAVPTLAAISDGAMAPEAMRMSWSATMTLLATSLFAAARMSTAATIVYVVVVTLARLVYLVLLDPRLLADGWMSCGQSLIFSMMAALLVGTIRRAAVTLDQRIARTTTQSEWRTSAVAREAARTEVTPLVAEATVRALRTTARASDPARWNRARSEASDALATVDTVLDTDTGGAPPALAPREFHARIAAAIARHTPDVPVSCSGERTEPVPVAVLDHFLIGIRAACPDADPEVDGLPFFGVHITFSDSAVECRLALTPRPDHEPELAAALPTAAAIVSALPGASLEGISEGAAPRVRYRRRPPAGHAGHSGGLTVALVLRWSEDAVTAPDSSDPSDKAPEGLRLAHLVSGRRGTVVGAALYGLFAGTLASQAIITRDLFLYFPFHLVLLVGYLVLAAGLVNLSLRPGPHPAARPGIVAFAMAWSMLMVLGSLLTMRDPDGFVMEVQWWHATAVLVLLVWLTGARPSWVTTAAAILLALVMAGWGYATGQDAGVLTGGGVPLVAAISLAAILTRWSAHETADAMLHARQDRSERILDAHLQAATTERRALSRYLDDVARAFLVQVSTGFPLTHATRRRAGQLAARVHDDLVGAPFFRDTDVARSAADARARAVTVSLQDGGALDGADPALRRRVVRVAVQAIDAMVDGAIDVQIAAVGAEPTATIVSRPAAKEQRRIDILIDGSVVYDGIRVRPSKQVRQ